MTEGGNDDFMVTKIRLEELFDTDHCPMRVTRKGEDEPCDRPAIAAWTHWWDGRWYTDPVCAYHAHMNGKYGTLVPLSVLLSSASGVGCHDR